VRLFTRRGYDWTERYPLICKAVATIPALSTTIDGEAVSCDAGGVAVFDRLQSRDHDADVFLYAFDLLELDGKDLRARSLEVRKDRLAKLIAKAPADLRFSEHVEGDGAVIFLHACLLGLEGMVSNRRDHIYRSGPTKAWLKIKNPNAPGVLRFEEPEP
jgi:bifunctional non-homologous end joining protein LigD